MKKNKKPFVTIIGLSVFLLVSTPGCIWGAGAKTPFITLEGEKGQLGGGAEVKAFVHGSEVPRTATLELEASGGAYVKLALTGSSVSWTNPIEGTNTLVIRNSIPDTMTGGGMDATLDLLVDGVFRQTVTVSSRQSWVYRTKGKGWIDDPREGGMPFKFYNEDRVKIDGEPIKKGSVITLLKSARSVAKEYNIDCVDFEAVAPPRMQPTGSLSVVDFGADPTGTTDCQKAIQNCLNKARESHQTVWFPAGKFLISSEVPKCLDFTGLTVCGAGMWHTTLYRMTPTKNTGRWESRIRIGTGSHLSDVFIDCNSVRRDLAKAGGGSDYGILAGGDGWVVERVWTQHCDANWLQGSNCVIRDSRAADHWGDGFNLNNGNRPTSDNRGHNMRAENNFSRGAGDDGFATYSDAGPKGDNGKMSDVSFINNTAVAPYWANSLRVAGGIRVVVRGNLLCDPGANSGITVGTFGQTGHPLESAIIEDNEIRRGGGWNGTDRHGMVISYKGVPGGSVTVRNNIIVDSRRSGILIEGSNINVILENNHVDNPAGSGIWIAPGVTGKVAMSGNTISGLQPGQKDLKNESPNVLLR